MEIFKRWFYKRSTFTIFCLSDYHYHKELLQMHYWAAHILELAKQKMIFIASFRLTKGPLKMLSSMIC